VALVRPSKKFWAKKGIIWLTGRWIKPLEKGGEGKFPGKEGLFNLRGDLIPFFPGGYLNREI